MESLIKTQEKALPLYRQIVHRVAAGETVPDNERRDVLVDAGKTTADLVNDAKREQERRKLLGECEGIPHADSEVGKLGGDLNIAQDKLEKYRRDSKVETERLEACVSTILYKKRAADSRLNALRTKQILVDNWDKPPEQGGPSFPVLQTEMRSAADQAAEERRIDNERRTYTDPNFIATPLRKISTE